jgi:hypothetical protein
MEWNSSGIVGLIDHEKMTYVPQFWEILVISS